VATDNLALGVSIGIVLRAALFYKKPKKSIKQDAQ
tara:strand:- start:912 stop:1016 length:105 start_codon:yes stop_codon:yes gene_type:complete